ncbi:eukaryotic translation initiation factor 4E [Stereum hirsutum FP-91666 SS1]|uniref:eukaryotic translation initiation factor 4E n=1 Tax=Stereum hirsutum (strain FP-91666) TaxID=721885 RepID=UPI000444A641|nr:eukaryotic translation initiation factor 4E [Stereum hirsutum FP-91666 SS1]EIM86853.1 eukaryotic translation initiation factor 4E [Stereum hirsutum FP-91666 SS1]
MAGYFSNHSASHSRFVANSGKDKDSSTTTTVSTPPTSNISATTPSAGIAARPRIPSRHFSTSLTETETAGLTAGQTTVHPLRSTWVFWFRQQRTPGNKITNYEEGIKKIAAFSSVESFWSLWTHLLPPSALLPTTDYLLFHSGVRRPVWEDPLNLPGGKWIIRLRKGVADRLWEDLVLAIVGDQFADVNPTPGVGSGGPLGNTNGNGVSGHGKEDSGTSEEVQAPVEKGKKGDDKPSWRSGAVAGVAPSSGKDKDKEKDVKEREEEWPEICGCTISVRQSEDIISIWNRVEDPKVRERIRDTIRRVLNLPMTTVMEYKSNNDSMQDKSSFRNSAIDRTPLS